MYVRVCKCKSETHRQFHADGVTGEVVERLNHKHNL